MADRKHMTVHELIEELKKIEDLLGQDAEVKIQTYESNAPTLYVDNGDECEFIPDIYVDCY